MLRSRSHCRPTLTLTMAELMDKTDGHRVGVELRRDGAADMLDPLLTARQVASDLAVSTETILRWTRRGELPAIRLPSGQLRYRPGAVTNCLAGWATTGQGDVRHLATEEM